MGLTTSFTFDKGDTLLKLFEEYGGLLEYSLGVQLNVGKPEKDATSPRDADNQMENSEEGNEQLRVFIKNLEEKIECKLLAIDILKLVYSHFSQEGKRHLKLDGFN